MGRTWKGGVGGRVLKGYLDSQHGTSTRSCAHYINSEPIMTKYQDLSHLFEHGNLHKVVSLYHLHVYHR